MGLISYYRKFIKVYGLIVAPLITLLKNKAFNWSEVVSMSFEELKRAITEPLVFSLPDFNHKFTLECDTSGYDVGAVLMQGGRPVAFMSKALKGRTL